jgi:EAL domain-containing protein (putative c-di-GMP-specific phosphodiesterase class I)
VQRIIAETGLPPSTLELEITESVLMSDAEASRATLSQLKAMGVRVAVDDFGTGYSSLAYLRRFPIDVLKIDRSFVSGIGSSEDDGSIAGAVISMGSSLKYRVVAEGVEDRSQLDFLRARHCDEAQGYYFSAPLDAAAFERLLAARPADWRTPRMETGT